MAKRSDRPPRPFNSSVETGLRMLVLLEAAEPAVCDVGRLVVYDYLLVHSDDADGPVSLHPRTPHRSGELLVRRQTIVDGLVMLVSKELATVTFDERGVTYSASVLTKPFLDHLESVYARDLRERAKWVAATFGEYTDARLMEFATSHLSDWGGELVNESLLRRREESP